MSEIKKKVAIFDADMVIFDILGINKEGKNVRYFNPIMQTSNVGDGLPVEIVKLYDKVDEDTILEEIKEDCGIYCNDRVNKFFETVDYRTVPTMLSFDILIRNIGLSINKILEEVDKIYVCSKVMPSATNTCTKTIAINTHMKKLRKAYPNIKEHIVHYTYTYGEKVLVVEEDEELILFVDDNYKEFSLESFEKHTECNFGLPADVVYISKVEELLESLNLHKFKDTSTVYKKRLHTY